MGLVGDVKCFGKTIMSVILPGVGQKLTVVVYRNL